MIYLTPHILRTLYFSKSRRTLWNVLAPNSSQQRIPFYLSFLGFVVLCVCTLFPYFILPLLINTVNLRFALRAADAIAQQFELGRREVLTLTPIGEYLIAFEICRAYLVADTETVFGFINSSKLKMGVLAALFIFAIPLMITIALNLAPPEDDGSFLLFAIFGICVCTVYEYEQSLALATFISLVAGSTESRATARLWTLGGYTVSQLLSYTVAVVVWSILSPILTFDGGLNPLAMAFAIAVLFFVREMILNILWQAIYRRIDLGR